MARNSAMRVELSLEVERSDTRHVPKNEEEFIILWALVSATPRERMRMVLRTAALTGVAPTERIKSLARKTSSGLDDREAAEFRDLMHNGALVEFFRRRRERRERWEAGEPQRQREQEELNARREASWREAQQRRKEAQRKEKIEHHRSRLGSPKAKKTGSVDAAICIQHLRKLTKEERCELVARSEGLLTLMPESVWKLAFKNELTDAEAIRLFNALDEEELLVWLDDHDLEWMRPDDEDIGAVEDETNREKTLETPSLNRGIMSPPGISGAEDEGDLNKALASVLREWGVPTEQFQETAAELERVAKSRIAQSSATHSEQSERGRGRPRSAIADAVESELLQRPPKSVVDDPEARKRALNTLRQRRHRQRKAKDM